MSSKQPEDMDELDIKIEFNERDDYFHELRNQAQQEKAARLEAQKNMFADQESTQTDRVDDTLHSEKQGATQSDSINIKQENYLLALKAQLLAEQQQSEQKAAQRAKEPKANTPKKVSFEHLDQTRKTYQIRKKLEKEPNVDIDEGRTLYLFHYCLYSLYFMIYFWGGLSIPTRSLLGKIFNAFAALIIPSCIIYLGIWGLVQISKSLLSRARLSKIEASSTFAYMILYFFIVYASVAISARFPYSSVVYLTTPNPILSCILFFVCSVFALKTTVRYEWMPIFVVSTAFAVYVTVLGIVMKFVALKLFSY